MARQTISILFILFYFSVYLCLRGENKDYIYCYDDVNDDDYYDYTDADDDAQGSKCQSPHSNLSTYI